MVKSKDHFDNGVSIFAINHYGAGRLQRYLFAGLGLSPSSS